MKKSTMIRSLVLCGLSMLLCISMLAGSTFAWFTDEVQSGNNVIMAGNLDVALDYYKDGEWKDVEGKSDVFDPNALWEPGHTEVAYLRISNKGNLALKYLFSINIVEEKIGLTKDGKDIKLSDVIKFGIVENVTEGQFNGNRAAAIAAVENPQPLAEALSNQHEYASRKGELLAKAEGATEDPSKVVAVVVWMPTDVGNEANHDGVNVPYIKLGINLAATQYTYEEDAFDDQYDADAEFSFTGKGTTTIKYPSGDVAFEVQVRNPLTGAKVGSVLVDRDSLKDGVTEIGASFEKGTKDPNLTVAAGLEEITYDIDVTGLKDGNTVPVKVDIRIPAGLDKSTVALYHYDEPVTDAVYDPNSGYIVFTTTDFSPFTAVFDADSEYVPPVVEFPEGSEVPEGLPEANVVLGDLSTTPGYDGEWGEFGGFGPDYSVDADPKLETVFVFSSKDDAAAAEASKFADWHCDFYVKLDRALGENQIFLGGAYGDFGWVGFHNGDVTLEANEEIPLLGSVTNNPWTYSQVVSFVREFTCGVGDVDDALSGATFTVMLRLTNPEDETEFYNVAVITHTFQ